MIFKGNIMAEQDIATRLKDAILQFGTNEKLQRCNFKLIRLTSRKKQ